MLNFQYLSDSILETHSLLQQSAVRAINMHVTIRNWLIGYYIVEFEQKGEDRAKYGSKLLFSIAENLNNKSLSESNLKVFRLFYITYPQIGQSVIIQLKKLGLRLPTIGQSAIAELKNIENIEANETFLTHNIDENIDIVSPNTLLAKLSYTHLVQLLPIADPIKRGFYEAEAIKGTWSVRELKRQISTLFFERSGMSKNPNKLSLVTNEKAEKFNSNDLIKSHFVFEFLGLKTHEVVMENDLEAALVENLQDFILEMGYGFCFEARQKRILIDDEYYFIDLVFYHRILKCHVLLELKTDVFKSEYASQLNAYVAFYNDQIREKDDNPTVGILLCTEKGKKLVEYALSGMDPNLFVSKYLVNLPSKETLEKFIENETKK